MTLQTLAREMMATPALAIVMTLAAYMLALSLYRLMRYPSWAPPMLTGSLLLALFIAVLPVDYDTYYLDAHWLTLLLGPATVGLAVPLYEQFQHIKRLLIPLTVSLLVGSITACAATLAIAWALGLSPDILASLAPKSITTPIAIGVSEGLGGYPGLTAGIVTVTGILAASTIPPLALMLRCHDPRVVGLALGLNGHGLGTARGFGIDAQTGAFASLAMGLNGALSAIVLPWLAGWLGQ
ncbi:membrane protein [Kushneria pakistanensis]|uniref:Membrane protein n=1 Tax=Kushneria pakistanensis TaxID=1508770 RepID=A0ABQ3FBU0_9GAMM|nr:LrgB family protein [Kushneria pakistanensis]GHC17744.1 membrane protein [Kushneria pakistanensis]